MRLLHSTGSFAVHIVNYVGRCLSGYQQEMLNLMCGKHPVNIYLAYIIAVTTSHHLIVQSANISKLWLQNGKNRQIQTYVAAARGIWTHTDLNGHVLRVEMKQII